MTLENKLKFKKIIFKRQQRQHYNFTCCCSVPKSCPTLYVPMNCSTPGVPVLNYLPEFLLAQTKFITWQKKKKWKVLISKIFLLFTFYLGRNYYLFWELINIRERYLMLIKTCLFLFAIIVFKYCIPKWKIPTL